MMKYLKLTCIILIIGFTLISCSQEKKSDNIAYRITEKDLIPEGITYSSTTNSFYISSIHKAKIIQIDAKTGEFKDFVSPETLNMRFLGMIVDEDRNHLWACGNMDKSSTVARFDLKTGELLKSFLFTDTIENIYNDLVQDKHGNVYFTNVNKQTVYCIDQQTDSLSIFYDGYDIIYPNGISISDDNKYLYIASSNNGIRVLDMESREIIGGPDSTFYSSGIDGLKYYKNTVIGIQNWVKSSYEVKIAQYILNESGSKIVDVKIIDQNNPYFEIPTTFVIVNDELFCLANSQLANIDFETNKIKSYEALNDVVVLKYKLE